MDTYLRLWSAGARRSKEFKLEPLTETAAIDIGAEMLGEVVVFSVGVGVIGLEYWRQTANAARKEQKQDDTLVMLRKDINQLTEMVVSRQQSIDELTKILENYQSKDLKLVKTDPKEDAKRLRPKG